MTDTQPTSLLSRLLTHRGDELSPEERKLKVVLDQPLSAGEAVELHQLIASYFAAKARRELDQTRAQRGWTREMMHRVATGELSWDDLP